MVTKKRTFFATLRGNKRKDYDNGGNINKNGNVFAAGHFDDIFGSGKSNTY